MRNTIAGLLALVFVFSAGVWAADSGTVVADGTSWTNVGGSLLEVLLPLISLLIVGLGIPYVLKLLKKAGLENQQLANDLLTKLVKQGINWADAWATGLAAKPGSADKKAQAVQFIVNAAAEAGLAKLAEEKLSQMIEAQLARDAATVPVDGNTTTVTQG